MAKCAECGLPVLWTRTPGSGAWQCFNPDGTVHWDRCSAERFACIKREGFFFAKPTEEGYKHPKKLQYTMLRPGHAFCGDRYRLDGCDCGLPPWELCKPTCSHAIGIRS